MEFPYNLHPLGDNGVIIQFGNEISNEVQGKVQKIAAYLDQCAKEWLIDYIPAFTTVAVYYNPLKVPMAPHQFLLPYDRICRELQQILAELKINGGFKQRVVEIPVCYVREFAPDLDFIAAHNDLSIEEVVTIHANGDYLVHMIGFSPGFPYIGGLSEKITAPRRETPRLKIPARSVGIAGRQTGIYPIETPGGWQIIGRTPLELFRPNEALPSLLKAGDRVKFKPISIEEYTFLEDKIR